MRGCSGATLAGLQVEFINPIFEFSRAMRRLGLDDAEYALLIAINIFSADRPNVQEPSRVEALQQPYVEALLSYTRIKRPQVRKLPRPGRQARCWVWWTMWGVLSLGSVCLCSQILVSVSRVSVLMRSAAMSQALGWVRGWPDPSWYWLSRLSWPRWAGPPSSTCLLSPAGSAPLPTHAHEAGEPAHPELRAFGAGLCPAAAGQEAAASAVRDLGCARVGTATSTPALVASRRRTLSLPFLLGWEDTVTAQPHGAQPQAQRQLAPEGPTPPTESSRGGEGHRS